MPRQRAESAPPRLADPQDQEPDEWETIAEAVSDDELGRAARMHSAACPRQEMDPTARWANTKTAGSISSGVIGTAADLSYKGIKIGAGVAQAASAGDIAKTLVPFGGIVQGASTAAVTASYVTGGVGVAAMLVNGGIQGRAAWKSRKHKKALQELMRTHLIYRAKCTKRAKKTCTCGISLGDMRDHLLVENVLQYAVAQKGRKMKRRTGAAIPLVQMGISAHRFYRWAKKKKNGTKGQARTQHATHLARHLLETHCELAQEVVAELLDEQTAIALMWSRDMNQAVSLIKDKLKSI